MKLQFSKSYLSYQEQIELLKSRNLEILDSNYALKKLSNINYYRLSAYFYPFFDQKDTFRKDVTFEQIMQLYYFDKEFRTLEALSEMVECLKQFYESKGIDSEERRNIIKGIK